MELKQYSPELKYGVTIGSGEVVNGGAAAGAIPGTALTTTSNFGSVSVNTNGTVVVPLFPSGTTAPVAGTITNVNIIAGDTTKGTIDLVSDQGTLVTLYKNGTLGGGTGTVMTPIAFKQGSLLTVVSRGTDNANLEAVFYTNV